VADIYKAINFIVHKMHI